MSDNPYRAEFADLKDYIYARNSPAFPCEQIAQIGLTKREYFAAMAMQGLMHDSGITEKIAAEVAVNAADALIKELSK